MVISDRTDDSDFHPRGPHNAHFSSPSPVPPTWGPGQRRSSSGPWQEPAGRSPRPYLGVAGNVPDGMQHMAHEIEYDIRKRPG